MKVEHVRPDNFGKGGDIDLERIQYGEAVRLKDTLLTDEHWEDWRELIKALELIIAANEPACDEQREQEG